MISAERPLAASSERVIPDDQILLQPQGRPGDLLRLVPGLIPLEHSGGNGKADQYLLRGFDADHGTDLALFFDAMPINLRSHAHGQGYADLNFIIPETIERIESYKGPYYVQFGDFTTAGAVRYVTREVVPLDIVQAAWGQFNTQRYITMVSPTKERVPTLLAGEVYYTDGPFLSENRNIRFNGLAKLTFKPTAASKLNLTASQLYGSWNGSGQIPLREVMAGRLDRFGSIDDSEGGESARTTLHFNAEFLWPQGSQAFAKFWGQYYKLDLFSNFTFFLNDQVNGDGIEQNDRRWIYGGHVGYRHFQKWWNIPVVGTLGFMFRGDDAHVRLGTQKKRQRLDDTQESDIVEVSYSPYASLDLDPFPWFHLFAGLRADIFTFDVTDACGTGCTSNPQGHAQDGLINPKVSAVLGPWLHSELYLNFGQGFHSNDARAVVSNPRVNPLPRATGYEVGLRITPWTRMEWLFTGWLLDLDSELVFVGDEGTTEIRGPTRRFGTEVSLRLTPWEWLVFRGDVTATSAKFRETGEAVPLAPLLTGFASITTRLPFGFSSNFQMIHVGVRPATEDRSVNLEPFTVFDFVMRQEIPIKLSKGHFEAFFNIRNITDTEWRGAQFFFDSRLPGEPGPVGDIHFVPGTPRMVMGGLTWVIQ